VVRKDVEERNKQRIKESHDIALVDQKVLLKTSKFIPALNAARLGKLTACLLVASDRNDYAIIMVLLVRNVPELLKDCRGLLLEKIIDNVHPHP